MDTANATSTQEVILEVEGSQEPTNEVETTGTGEDTPINETKASVEGGDAKRSSQLISQLGEEKRQIAEKLVALGKTSPEAQAQLKEMVEADTSLATYFKKKFGTEYDNLVASSPEARPDLDTIREQERAKARAELLQEQFQNATQKEIDGKAQSYRFNSEEVSIFKQKVDLLMRAGDSVDEAIKNAALLTNPTKATAGSYGSDLPPTGQQAPPQHTVTTQTYKISPAMAEFGESRFGGRQGLAEAIKSIKDRTTEDWRGNPVLNLPSIHD